MLLAIGLSALLWTASARTGTAPADDITLSTASGRESAYIAVHLYRGTPHQAYFTAVERIMTAHGGRPHWGKVHTHEAAELSRLYPRWDDFQRVRRSMDPTGVFLNEFARRLFGD